MKGGETVGLPMESRMQRLRTLENKIRSGMEEFYYVGMALKEIRDDELYKEDGFTTWKEYCRVRWDYSDKHVYKLIKSSEYRAVIPDVADSATSEQTAWTEFSVRELTRIPDKKQAARVAKKVLIDVEKSRKEVEQGKAEKPLKLSASTVRKYVDADLGVDRGAKAAETRQQRMELPKLEHYLAGKTGVIQSITKHLSEVPKEGWEWLHEKRPEIIGTFVNACNHLAELMRSTKTGKDE